MQAKLIIAFDQLNEADFLTRAGSIVASLTPNPNFPEPWLPQIPTLAVFTTAKVDYETAYHAALTKDINKVALRESRRLTLTTIMKQLAPYFELISQGNLVKLGSTGYDLRHDSAHTSGVDPLTAPLDFQVSHGTLSGTLDLKVARLENAASYDVHLAELDPLIEANWKHVLSSNTATHMLLSNLIPGQTYWLRVRGIGTNGNGAWTDPVHIIVV